MEIRLKQYWFNIKSSLWFLPALMALSAVILAFGLLELDSRITYKDFPIKWFIYGGQPEGARSVLSTIASSMVTIAGVTFSITLVALTMASAQFGPRLLRNFIANRGNQFVIGTFISTFIYSLIVLLSIRGSDDDEFIPKIAVVFAFLMAVFSLGVLIFFIHHAATSIQADYVIKASFNDFEKLADESLLDVGESLDLGSYTKEVKKIQNEYALSAAVCYHTSGFIQSIDYKGTLKWAEKNEAAVEWLVHPGLFATIYQKYAVIHHKKPLQKYAEAELRNFIVVDYQRTPNQDLLFSLRQISEVGVRALSPGTNDPYTAITCIQWLGAALAILIKKKFDAAAMKAEDGEVRVLIRQISYQAIVDTCFDHLTLYAKSNMYVTAEIFSAIKRAVLVSENNELMQLLKNKATGIYKDSKLQYADDLLPAIEKDYWEILEA